MGISLCIIVKNESRLLKNCLESIYKHVDEIVVVDNGSTDATREVAEKFNCKIVNCPNTNHDGGRNAYLEVASKPWILVLDADERITSTSINEIRRYITSAPPLEILGLRIPRIEYIGGGKWAAIDLLRLFRNNPEIRYDSRNIHSSPITSIKKLGGKIENLPYATIHHFDILYKGRTSNKRERNIRLLLSEIEKEEDLHSRYFLGLEYAALGRYEDAEFEYRKAIALDSGGYDSTRARLYLAQQYLLLGKLNLAQDEANTLLSMNTSLNDRVYTLLAEIALQRKELEVAFKLCEQALKTNLLGAHHHINLASMLVNEDPLKAIGHLNRAIEINPYITNPVIYRNGELPNIFQQQNSFLSNTKTVYEYLEVCWEKLGQTQNAHKWKSTNEDITRAISQHETEDY